MIAILGADGAFWKMRAGTVRLLVELETGAEFEGEVE